MEVWISRKSSKAILDMRNDVGKGLETGKYKYLEESRSFFLLKTGDNRLELQCSDQRPLV